MNSSTAVGVYPDYATEREKIYACNDDYAMLFGGTSLHGEQVTEHAFKAAAEQARVIHFHGHAAPDPGGNILDQALQLYTQVETSQCQAPLILSSRHRSSLVPKPLADSLKSLAIGTNETALNAAVLQQTAIFREGVRFEEVKYEAPTGSEMRSAGFNC